MHLGEGKSWAKANRISRVWMVTFFDEYILHRETLVARGAEDGPDFIHDDILKCTPRSFRSEVQPTRPHTTGLKDNWTSSTRIHA